MTIGLRVVPAFGVSAIVIAQPCGCWEFKTLLGTLRVRGHRGAMVPQPAGPVGTPRLSGQETAHFYDGEDVTPSPHYTDGLPVIRLYTRDGRYVASVPTMPWVKDGDPDVVLWGSRCFVLHRPSLSYREAFAWVCPFDALPEPTPTTEKT